MENNSRVIRMLDRPPVKPIEVTKIIQAPSVQTAVVRKPPRPRKQTSRGILLGTQEVTRRQYEIIILSLEYKSINMIANELGIAPTTVSMLKSRMINKFGNWLTILQLAADRERSLLGKAVQSGTYVTPDELRTSAGYRLALTDTIQLAMDPSITKDNLIKLLHKRLFVREGESSEHQQDQGTVR